MLVSLMTLAEISSAEEFVEEDSELLTLGGVMLLLSLLGRVGT